MRSAAAARAPASEARGGAAGAQSPRAAKPDLTTDKAGAAADQAAAPSVTAPDAAAQQRAFGFSELGLLGQAPGAAGAIARAVPSATDPLSAASATAPSRSAVAPAGVLIPGSAPRGGASGATTTGAASSPRLVADRSSSAVQRTVVAPLSAARAILDPDAPDALTSTPAASRARQDAARRPGAPSSTVSLILTESGGAAQIVSAAAGVDPDAAVRLRKIIGDLLTEHGLRLSAFSLNGGPIKSEIAITGDVHGDSGR
ncbi:MAG: hypothetical protein P4L64_09070 [Caulobacteraceae bacterium]|nr:hypothetical protein [Caulobacteraceae bacterium]